MVAGLESATSAELAAQAERGLAARPRLAACLPARGLLEHARMAGRTLNGAVRHSHEIGALAPGVIGALEEARAAWERVTASVALRPEGEIVRPPSEAPLRRLSLRPDVADRVAVVAVEIARERQIVLWWTLRGLPWPAPVAARRAVLELRRQRSNAEQLQRYLGSSDLEPLLGALAEASDRLLRPVTPLVAP